MKSIDLFKELSNIDKNVDIVNQNLNSQLSVNNATPEVSALFTALTFKKAPHFIVYVTPNLYKASQAYEMFSRILGSDDVELFGCDEVMTTSLLGEGSELGLERLHALKSLIKATPKIIITHMLALTLPLVPRDALIHHILHIKQGDNLKRQEFITVLIDNGYKMLPLTQEVGTFSIRGEVIDIWPLFYDKPIRLDFFDIEIENIYTFDPVSQRRQELLETIDIVPLTDIVYSEHEIESLSDGYKKAMESYNQFDDLINHNNVSNLRRYIHLLYDHSETLLDYMSLEKNTQVGFSEYFTGLQSLNESLRQSAEYLESIPHPKDDLWEFNKPLIMPSHVSCIYYNANKQDDTGLDLNSYPVIGYNGDMKVIMATLNSPYNKQKHYIFTFTSLERLKLFSDRCQLNNITFSTTLDLKEKICLIALEDSISFNVGDYNVISEQLIFPGFNTNKSKFHKAYGASSEVIKSINDIKEGDYVVHEDYGIAQYQGIKTVTLNNITNDYLTLQYRNEVLYCPVEQIGKLVLYQSREGTIPVLTSLGGDEWNKKKAKVRARLQSMAHDVALLEAKRSQAQGFKYPPYDEMDAIFAHDAGFTETPDQMQAIKDCLDDLSSGKVMDRLICGDVGFGKTEVAMRAAFKVACSQKQVAILAPTTILARQHYENFKRRFDLFGLQVKLLCRLVSHKDQKVIKEELAQGKIDVIVGTHALLSKEVKFKDLGLLVIDEEQRFGVAQKEKIKHLKENVAVISMSATPIPRTLQMALTGLRPMSLINTAPEHRYPVQTYVLEYNDIVMKEAIYRELGRQGQVFYLYNRVEDLEKIKFKINRLVPEARVTIIHGQMDSDSVENELEAYLDGQYDVLLCTTIIENGIDMPNTNTIIIEGAERLGLSQMYQLRGRVGRSNRIAYAYFFSSNNVLATPDGVKRLGAIKEFSALGSGYQLAMRDLAIRGAGDILGAEQSGFIDSVGMDLYLKMLDEVVNHKLETPEERVPKYNMSINKHVEEHYAGSNEMIIEIHKMINKVRNHQEYMDTKASLLDRFGTLPQDVEDYLLSIYVKYLLDERDIKFVENPLMVICNIPLTSEKNQGFKLFDYISRAKVITLEHEIKYMENYMVLKIKKELKDNKYLTDLMNYLESLDSVIRN